MDAYHFFSNLRGNPHFRYLVESGFGKDKQNRAYIGDCICGIIVTESESNARARSIVVVKATEHMWIGEGINRLVDRDPIDTTVRMFAARLSKTPSLEARGNKGYIKWAVGKALDPRNDTIIPTTPGDEDTVYGYLASAIVDGDSIAELLREMGPLLRPSGSSTAEDYRRQTQYRPDRSRDTDGGMVL